MDNSLIKLFEQNKRNKAKLDTELLSLLDGLYPDIENNEKYPKYREYITNNIAEEFKEKAKDSVFIKDGKIDVDSICDYVKTIQKYIEKIGDDVLKALKLKKEHKDYIEFIKNIMNKSIISALTELGVDIKEDEMFIKERSNNSYIIERKWLKAIANEVKLCLNESEINTDETESTSENNRSTTESDPVAENKRSAFSTEAKPKKENPQPIEPKFEKSNMEIFSELALKDDDNTPTVLDVIEATKLLKQEINNDSDNKGGEEC